MLNLEKSLAAFNEAKTLMPGGVNSPVRSYRNVDCNPPFIARGEGAHIAQNLLIGKDIRVAQLFHAVRRHAVAAPQIAAVRHRNAQIFNFPLKLILHDNLLF